MGCRALRGAPDGESGGGGARNDAHWAVRPKRERASRAHDVKTQHGPSVLLRQLDRPLRGAVDTAANGHVEQAYNVVAGRNVASRPHTRISAHDPIDPRWLNRDSEGHGRDGAATRRDADCHGSSLGLRLTQACGARRGGQQEQGDTRNLHRMRDGLQHGHDRATVCPTPSARKLQAQSTGSRGSSVPDPWILDCS